jgi:hypothetical protein
VQLVGWVVCTTTVKKCFLSLRPTALLLAEGKKPQGVFFLNWLSRNLFRVIGAEVKKFKSSTTVQITGNDYFKVSDWLPTLILTIFFLVSLIYLILTIFFFF